jgi:hypothetical protein
MHLQQNVKILLFLEKEGISLLSEQRLVEKTYIMGSFMICNPYPVLFGGQIEKNKMSETCSTYARDDMCIQGLDGAPYRKENARKTQA